MMEIIVVLFIITWVILYYVEASATKRNKFTKYAWFARTMSKFIFFLAMGLFLIILGGYWKYSVLENIIGIIFILIGIILVIHGILKRKSIQTDLEAGSKKPITGDG